MICTPHRSFLLGSDAVSACVVADDSKYRSAAIFKVIQPFKQECITLNFKVQLFSLSSTFPFSHKNQQKNYNVNADKSF